MSPRLPPLKTIHRALQSITETLAGELANPGTHAPAWSELDWRVARAVSAIHGVSALLSQTLRWKDVPEDWSAFLQIQTSHTASRFERIRELLSRIELRMQQNDLAGVALKGAALHSLGLYTQGERPMADVDLLVRREDSSRAASVLESLGYRQTLMSARHLVFAPQQSRSPMELGEHSENDIKIELHGLISERLPLDLIDITETVFPRDPRAGLNPYPSHAALMTHLLFHAAGAMSLKALRLLHLNDVSRLAKLMTDNDWGEFIATRVHESHLWWAHPPLRLAARYFSCVPGYVLDETEAWCPRSLARASARLRLSDASYSYLWIDAFPGITWATSPREKMRYALSRIFVSSELREGRAALLRAEPTLRQGEWARLSQSRRILRWLASKPPRAESIGPVRAALEQGAAT